MKKQLLKVIEAAAQTWSVKKVFLEISQNSQEHTCARAFIKIESLAQAFSFQFCEISKNAFSYRTPPVAAFESNISLSKNEIYPTMESSIVDVRLCSK